MNQPIQPGAVLRVSRLGDIVPAEGHNLVLAFLGACRLEHTPDVPALLRRLGWQRSFVFEATLAWDYGDDRDCSTHHLSATDPREAVLALVRLASREVAIAVGTLIGAELKAINIGPVNDAGVSQTRRGNVFLSWHASAGESLAMFVDRFLASTAATSPSSSAAVPDADSPAAAPATPSTDAAPAS